MKEYDEFYAHAQTGSIDRRDLKKCIKHKFV
jgi:hypothetical protein